MNNKPLVLTLKEYELLKLLALNANKVLTREYLIEQVWGYEFAGEGRTVDVHIGRLRKLLNPGREQDPIRTVRGAGYALDDRFAKVEP